MSIQTSLSVAKSLRVDVRTLSLPSSKSFAPLNQNRNLTESPQPKLLSSQTSSLTISLCDSLEELHHLRELWVRPRSCIFPMESHGYRSISAKQTLMA